jgi:DHA1 family multidrug resistance protein-like MFS transporter
VLGAGPATAGLALAVFAVGNAMALTFSGRLADSVGRRPLVVAGLTVAGLAIAAIGFIDSVPAFVAASVIAGFGSGLLGPAQQAAVGDIIGNDRTGGKVLAVFQMGTDAGAIIGPVLAGMLADRLNYAWAFGVTGAVMLASALLWLVFGRETLMKPVKETTAD